MDQVAPEADVSRPAQTTVSDETRRAEPERSAADEALRLAIKAALDGGDFNRVRALVTVLEATPKAAPVLTLASRKAPR